MRIPRLAFEDVELPTHRAVVASALGDNVDLYVSPALRRLIDDPSSPFADARNLAAASVLAADRGQYLWDVDIAIALGAKPTDAGVQAWRREHGVPKPPAGWPAGWSPPTDLVQQARRLAESSPHGEPDRTSGSALSESAAPAQVDAANLPVAIGEEVDGYLIQRELGRGGMGVVFLAVDQLLNRSVALKIIAPHVASDEVIRKRFLREARIAASLRHPHALQVYKVGETRGTLYICMRYVDGPALSDVIDQEVFLEPDRVALLVQQVAGALDEAHDRGFVHRDVKPQNILLSKVGHQEFAYLSDFGLARAIEDTGLTRPGLALGTPSYMAPEQILGRTVDKAADIYSLGCVLYECLTGNKPFERESSQAVLYAHANELPPRASEANSLLPASVDEIIVQAMAKEPNDRYPSAGDLADAVLNALAQRR